MKETTAEQLARERAKGTREFRRLHLTGEALNGDFRECSFDDCMFESFEFVYAQLDSCTLRRCHVSSFVVYESAFHNGFINNGLISTAKFLESDLTDLRIGAHRLQSVTFETCDLRGAQFVASAFSFVTFKNCDFREAKIGTIDFLSCDVSDLCRDMDEITWIAPCEFNEKTILRSVQAPRLAEFLVRCGMAPLFAKNLVDSARAVASEGRLASMLQSTFISYGGPDHAFAEALHVALQKSGVQTFFFPEHAEPGKKLHRLMREGVNQYERVVLVCSKASLIRPGVLNEIEETLAREARDGGAEYLIPIRIDDFVFNGWDPPRKDLAQAVRDRVVADFSDPAKFDRALLSLLGALNKKPK